MGEPVELLRLPYDRDDLHFVLVNPMFEAPTAEMRAVLPKETPMKSMINNCCQGGSLVRAHTHARIHAWGAPGSRSRSYWDTMAAFPAGGSAHSSCCGAVACMERGRSAASASRGPMWMDTGSVHACMRGLSSQAQPQGSSEPWPRPYQHPSQPAASASQRRLHALPCAWTLSRCVRACVLLAAWL